MKRVFCLVLAAMLAALHQAAVADLALKSYGVRVSTQVKSLYEMRHAGIVQQKWDQSCGSAALSTLLTYYLDAPVDETAIIGDMVRHGDPLRVRQRGGFSLLDLKRYAQRRGYQSAGYGRLSVEELREFNSPAIVPIKTRGYDHFVIFAGIVGDRVLIADPAYGNASLTIRQFRRLWQNGIALFVFKDGARTADAQALPPIPRLSNVGRVLRGMGPVPATRVGR
jgi:hypothetical protein